MSHHIHRQKIKFTIAVQGQRTHFTYKTNYNIPVTKALQKKEFDVYRAVHRDIFL